MKRLADALSLPVEETGEGGAARERMAKFTEGVKEFKEQVRRCFKLPSGLAAGQQLQMVIRIALAPSGALAHDPEMVAAKMSPLGPALRAAQSPPCGNARLTSCRQTISGLESARYRLLTRPDDG